MKKVKIIPTYIEVEQDKKIKYIPAYKIGEEDNNPAQIYRRGKPLLFDTPQEALNYLNE